MTKFNTCTPAPALAGAIVFLALALAAPAIAQQNPDAATLDEYNRRERAIRDVVLKDRLRLAKDLEDDELNAWARLEYAKILGIDADHPLARKRLGFARDGEKWVAGKAPALSPLNKESPSEYVAVTRADRYRKRLDTIASDAGKQNLKLADWCIERGLADLAQWHRLEAFALAPTDEAAAAALGYAPTKIVPLPCEPEVAKIVDRFRNGAADVALGIAKTPDDGWGPEEVRKNMRVVHGKHVGIESCWMNGDEKTAGWIEELARWGDHTYQIAHEFLDVEPPADDKRYWFMYTDYYKYQATTAWTQSGKPQSSYQYLLDAQHYRADYRAYHPSRQRGDTLPTHDLSHMVSQFVLTRRLWESDPEPDTEAALQEGFAGFCEYAGNKSNAYWCVGVPSTSTNTGGHSEYRTYAGISARRVSDRPASALLRSGFDSLAGEDGAGAAKAASIWEWLYASRGIKPTVAFMRDLAAAKPDIPAIIRKHFGWSPEEFDENWRRWAIAMYYADPDAWPEHYTCERAGGKCGNVLDEKTYKSGEIAKCPGCKARLIPW